MSVMTITRFRAAPADAEELTRRHAALVAATRANTPGLTDTRLARVDEENWVAVWCWDSAEHLRAAREGAPGQPETSAAFSLATNMTGEDAELVDVR